MSEAILSTYEYIRYMILSIGDGLLSEAEYPFISNQGHGAYIEAWSAGAELLTWSFLEGAVVAMYNAPYMRGKYKRLPLSSGMMILALSRMETWCSGTSHNWC